MRRVVLPPSVAVLAWLVGAPASAGDVPARLLNAEYVVMGYDLGTGILSASQATFESGSVRPEDREALEAVRRQIEAWDRFVIVDRIENADLVVAVRVGRRGTIRVGGQGIGAALSSPDDMLSVFEAEGGSIPLWRQHALEGLSGELPLLRAFRDELEAAAPH
jgi:hypothetical protein